MSDPKRMKSLYARNPLTYLTGASPATTPGEQTISASTAAPILVTHGFVIAGVDSNAGDAQYAAPSFLELLVELTGSAGDDAQESFSVWFYMPDAATTNKWRETAPFTASGVNKRGSVYAATAEAGNVYKIDCPQGATRAFIHVASLTANVNLHALAYPDNS